MIRALPARRAAVGLTAAAMPLILAAAADEEPHPEITVKDVLRAGKALKQLVKAGAGGSDRQEILEGLTDGDRVVVSGLAQIVDGMTVE
ncbi:hypothetical protein AB0B66_25040 [Catellatospora sp. NPDC049111]|uniref:hypothetical protein n=1 Tax=Catellatospora sp. NPDC049111 TaxID=3155271 RepID=UPI00340FBE26